MVSTAATSSTIAPPPGLGFDSERGSDKKSPNTDPENVFSERYPGEFEHLIRKHLEESAIPN
jgi:hypothetical protein